MRPGSCCIGLVMILLVNKRPKTVRCRSDQLFSITFLLTPCVTWNHGSVHWKPSVCSWVCLFSWLEMSGGVRRVCVGGGLINLCSLLLLSLLRQWCGWSWSSGGETLLTSWPAASHRWFVFLRRYICLLQLVQGFQLSHSGSLCLCAAVCPGL